MAVVVASFAPGNISPQNFPLSKPIINYIFENADSKLFKKFNQSCKYFFAKFEYNILDCLRLMDFNHRSKIFDGYRLQTNNVQKFETLKSNLWLRERLQLSGSTLSFYEMLMPKIIRCNLKSLLLYRSANLPLYFFKILTESGEIQELLLFDTLITNSDGSIVPVEDIFSFVSNANSITIVPANVNEKTMERLNTTKRECKLQNLVLQNISLEFNNEMFYQFIKENFDPSQYHKGFRISFVERQSTIRLNNFLRERLGCHVLLPLT